MPEEKLKEKKAVLEKKDVPEKKAVLFAFSVKSEKFESSYERNKFFRSLYGWKQVIKKGVIAQKGKETEKEVYEYQRGGVLSEMPHKKVDQSSFIVPEDDFDKIEKFMKEWRNKVIWKAFKILLDEDENEFFEEPEEEEEEVEEE